MCLSYLKFYAKIEVDELRGVELDSAKLLEHHYEELGRLQKIAFQEFHNELRTFYLTPVYRIDSRESLLKYLNPLTDDCLQRFAHHCKVIDLDAGITLPRNLLTEVLLFKYERGNTLLDMANSMPLYPDEKLLWYRSRLPDEDWSGVDYLWRHFTLFMLESTYSIKLDLEDAVSRLKPWMNELGDTEFSGWARMALPFQDFAITEVGPDDVSTGQPLFVHADLTVSIRMRETFRNEWLDLRRFDPVFLLHIQYDNVGTNPDEEAFFPRKYGVLTVRGGEILAMLDDNNQPLDEGVDYKPKGGSVSYRVALDPSQYKIDVESSQDGRNVYQNLNVIVRRKPKENNFKAVLETVRDIMNSECLVPEWLGDIILGYGDPYSAHYSTLPQPFNEIDFYDTFHNMQHVKDSFPDKHVVFSDHSFDSKFFKLTFQDDQVIAKSYEKESPMFIPFSENSCSKTNSIKFTPRQVEAIRSGLQHGLSLIVGPPGTGKTDVTVQIIATLFNTHPTQRTLIVTHSNQALNQIFDKIVNLDVDERRLIRLGHGEEGLSTLKDFSRRGRVNYVLERRLDLLKKVAVLQESLGIPGRTNHTCETAANLFTYQVKPRINSFLHEISQNHESKTISDIFPFTAFMNSIIENPFANKSYSDDLNSAHNYLTYIEAIFNELIEYRPFELLRNTRTRSDYLVAKTCRIVAMTCVHAALKRKDLIDLNFQYDNIIMEEAAQILEIETFIPMLLQNVHEGKSRLKRIILIGDHHQLPPIVRNLAFQKYCNMDQSLFSRLIRLGVPFIQLDKQGRCRPSLCSLFSWRYDNLQSLSTISNLPAVRHANPGFLYEFQLINVDDFQGVGESEPTRHFVQNLGEAEYAVTLFVYMRLCGYPADRISILTTYNGQKHLIRDIAKKKCSNNPLLGLPAHISTVDRFQGQQNDYIILSLVRTKTVGHLRDVRRLIVSMSRARLGLYILGRVPLFLNCFELSPTFQVLLQYPTALHIVVNEPYPTERLCDSSGSVPSDQIRSFKSVTEFSNFTHKFYLAVASQRQLEDERLEQEQKRLEELQKRQYEAYLQEMESLAEAQSKRYEGLIQNEIVDVQEADDS